MSVYDTVTEQILKELEAGTPPWVQSWQSQAVTQGLPKQKEIALDVLDCLKRRTTVICSDIVLALRLADLAQIAFCLGTAGSVGAPALPCLKEAVGGFLFEKALIAGADKLANDPPRSDFDQVIKLRRIRPLQPLNNSAFAKETAKYGTLLAEQNALLEAILITFERLQGAIGADEERFIIKQTEALTKFLHRLAEAQKKLQKAIERIQRAFAAFLNSGVTEEVARLTAQGFSNEENQLLQDAGLSTEDIQALDQVLLSLPADADIHGLAQQGFEQWSLFLTDMRAAVQVIEDIFERLGDDD